MTNKKIKLAISQGDINGIGYEVTLKALADERICELFTPIIYASGKALNYWAQALNLEGLSLKPIHSPEEANNPGVYYIDLDDAEDYQIEAGKPTEVAGRLALRSLEVATESVLAGRCQALVTAPINKSVMPTDGFPYSGHTGYLSAKAGLSDGLPSLMLLCSDDLRVALATEHIAIKDISHTLSTELIVDKVRRLHNALIRDYAITQPRIAVLALNPHAGDRGLMGEEEETIIAPALEQIRQMGIIAYGPYPADGFFASDRVNAFDAVLAMYHDQGLAPFKALHMDSGVNVTLGLSIIRTSPDHGTAYDLAGQGIASEASMRQALYTAVDLWRTRQRTEQALRNPLRNTFHNRNKEDESVDLRGE